MTRVPTERQYGSLRILGSGSAGLSWKRRETEQLLRRGWVTADELDGRYYQWVRITPAGLRAFADAVERYGLPDLNPARAGQPDPPLVQQLRSSRDQARVERDTAVRERRRLETRIRQARRALEEAPS